MSTTILSRSAAQNALSISLRRAVVVALAALVLFSNLHDVRASDGAPHIVIVGGGLAGLSAASEALDLGATVTLVEKEGRLGGNSAKATSGINAVGDEWQRRAAAAAGVEDSVELFVEDTMRSGRGEAKRELVDLLAEKSAAAIEYVAATGLDLSVLSQLGGHRAPRTHREPPKEDGRPRPIGFDIVTALRKKVEAEPERLEVLTGVTIESIDTVVERDGTRRVVSVSGVRSAPTTDDSNSASTDASSVTLTGDAIIMATGGFCADRGTGSLLANHRPDLLELPTTNGAWATGDGMRMIEVAGGQLIGMDRVQVHPTGFVDPKDPKALTKFLAPEALRGSGGILLSPTGHRFVDELQTRDTVTGAIYKYCATEGPVNAASASLEEDPPEALRAVPARDAVAYLVLPHESVEMFGGPAFAFYHRVKGFFTETDGVAALAAEIGADTRTVATTVAAYSIAARMGRDKFGKTVFPTSFDLTNDTRMYVARITPSLHYSMGGAAIDVNGRVLGGGGEVKGLYAAGEVTGGVHGANRLGGNSLLECVVFGRTAAQSAVREVQGLPGSQDSESSDPQAEL